MSNPTAIPLDLKSLPARNGAPHSDEAEHCAAVLLRAVSGQPGLLGAELDTDRGELTIQYDPTVLPAHQADDLAAQISQQLDHRYQICTTMLGGCCDSCSAAFQQGVGQANGGLGVVTVRPGRIALETTTPPILRAEVTRILHPEKAQVSDKAEPFWRTGGQAQWEVALTLTTLLGIAVAWGGSALGLSRSGQIAFYALAYLAGGYFGVREGLAELRRRAINVDLLMVLAAIGAATIGNWREGAILLFLFSLSNTLQSYAMGRSRRAIQALMKLRPEEALVKRDGREVRVRVEHIRLQDVVIVKPGERLPVDGRVRSGQSAIDQSTITGESIPVDVAPGSQVYAGTVNQSGALEIEVTHLASESTLARIIELVENAQEEKAPTQRFLDEFEQKYALGVIGATLLAIVAPVLLFSQPFAASFYRAMTLLVVASPCALVISVPASILSAIANAARRGILFKGGAHLENLAGIKAIAFDKTGTLTGGRSTVTDLVPLGDNDSDGLLALAAAVEARSEHPLALAIVGEARRRQLDFEPCEHFEAVSGRGARAAGPAGQSYLIGNRSLFRDGTIPAEVVAQIETLEAEGKTTMLLGEEQGGQVTLHGIIAVADQLRSDARQALQALRRLGIEHIIMLTGDNQHVAQAIAAQVGVDEFRAGLLPEEKVEAMQELRARYGEVAMVGDGVNDAPALATASLGIAMGAAGADVALETADVVLMSDDLAKLAYVVELSRRARRIVWQNIAFALGVIAVLVISNFVVGVPLPLGVVGHEGSTLVVVANGLRLLRGNS